MDQRLQIREIVDKEIRRGIFERRGRVSVGHAASADTRVSARQDINCRVPDHPASFTLSFSVGQNLIYPDRIGLLMVKTVAAVYGIESLVDAKPIEHGTTEVNRFIGQDSQFTVHQP